MNRIRGIIITIIYFILVFINAYFMEQINGSWPLSIFLAVWNIMLLFFMALFINRLLNYLFTMNLMRNIIAILAYLILLFTFLITLKGQFAWDISLFNVLWITTVMMAAVVGLFAGIKYLKKKFTN